LRHCRFCLKTRLAPIDATSMSKSPRNPLGQATVVPRHYAPEVLFPVPRSRGREALGLNADLPFQGEDIWNAWELSWLDPDGRPVVAVAELRVPAISPRLIESKSLKLYFSSIATMRYPSAAAVRNLIARDLEACAGLPVEVQIRTGIVAADYAVSELPGFCIDNDAASFSAESVDAQWLRSDPATPVAESLHSHLLRSLCPVTQQPDTGSLLISYRGPKIHRGALLQYLVSFRNHEAFHEACVERIFIDVKARCGTEQLTVYARYNRRGGLDINPFRSDYELQPPNIRLWRQ
jgi:7-cyano-7-deazaguanine reductase